MRETPGKRDLVLYGRASVEVAHVTEPTNQLETHAALQAQRRAVTPDLTRIRLELTNKERLRRRRQADRSNDWYWIDEDDPSAAPWGYFEDDDL